MPIETSINTQFQSVRSPAHPPYSKKGMGASLLTLGVSIAGMIETAGSGTTTLLNRVIRTTSPFFAGVSLVGLLSSSGVPRKVMTTLRKESWSLGIPAFYLNTDLFLNITNVVAKTWLGRAFMFPFGFQIGSVVDTFSSKTLIDEVTRQPQEISLNSNSFSFLQPPLLEGKKIEILTTTGKLLAGASLIFSGSYFTTDAIVQKFLIDFGTFITAAGITKPLWTRVETWARKKEAEWDINHIDLSSTDWRVSTLRVAMQAMKILLPTAIAATFWRPSTWQLALGGVFHGMESAHLRQSFIHKMQDLYPSKPSLSSCKIWSERSWQVLKIGGTAAGLIALQILALSNRNTIDTVAMSSFVGGWVIGGTTTLLADRIFHPKKSSPLMKEIAYRILYNSQLGGIDPLYLYYWITQMVSIGSNNLNTLPFDTAMLSFLVWVTLGARSAQDFVRTLSDRPLPHISKTLTFQNFFTLIAEVTGGVQ